MKTVATYYYATRDISGNATNNVNSNTNSDGDYVIYSTRLLYKDKYLSKPVAIFNNHSNNIQNANKKFSKINDKYLHERINIFKLNEYSKIELEKLYNFEVVYKDNSVDGITTIDKVKCKGKDSKGRDIHVTINFHNNTSSPVSWNPGNFTNFRRITIKREKK